jgi:hypothetical protein
MKNHPVNNEYVQNLVEGLVDEAAVRLPKKVRGEKPFQSRNPDTNKLESEIDNNDNYTVTSKRRPDGSIKKGSTEPNAEQSNEDWLTNNDDPDVKAKHDANRLQRKLRRKVKPAPQPALQQESVWSDTEAEPVRLGGNRSGVKGKKREYKKKVES